MSSTCVHRGFHSGASRYSHRRAELRYVIVCDACNAELRELSAVDYEPHFKPRSAEWRRAGLARVRDARVSPTRAPGSSR